MDFFFFLSIKTSALHPRDNLNFLSVWLYFQTLEEPHGLVLHETFWLPTEVTNSLVEKTHKIYFSLDLVRLSLLLFAAINQLTALCPRNTLRNRACPVAKHIILSTLSINIKFPPLQL